jgi:hypothetical protein
VTPDQRPVIVLRDLPGVAALLPLIEDVESFPNGAYWSPLAKELKAQVDAVSSNLFGITEADTRWDAHRDLRPGEALDHGEDRWWQLFEFPWDWEMPEGEAEALRIQVWHDLGWDVTDEAGHLYRALGYVERQMVCATNGLLGRLPGSPRTEAEIAVNAEAWGRALLQKPAQDKS